MTALWNEPDFDDHEQVLFVRDAASGLAAIIAIHSTHLGPAAGGTRFWHYPDPAASIRDALRLSRGMSYKNAMAGLPAGGGKAVILADANRTKTPEMLEAFAKAVDGLGGQYITAQDVNITQDDMLTIAKYTSHVGGMPDQGGDPGPYTARGIYLGIKAAAKRALGTEDLKGVRIAVQGVGSVGGGLARHLAGEGAKLILGDMNSDRAAALAEELGASTASADDILFVEADIVSPNALGAVLTEHSIPKLNTKVVAGGANNQLATGTEGKLLQDRGILYAPDYVINAGGIITVLRHIDGADEAQIAARVARIPERLEAVWQESYETGETPDLVADKQAQRLIGR